MKVLWRDAPITARDVFETLRDDGERIAYNTVSTILGNLHRKGLVGRTMPEGHYVYTPAVSQMELLVEVLGRVRQAMTDDAETWKKACSATYNGG